MRRCCECGVEVTGTIESYGCPYTDFNPWSYRADDRVKPHCRGIFCSRHYFTHGCKRWQAPPGDFTTGLFYKGCVPSIAAASTRSTIPPWLIPAPSPSLASASCTGLRSQPLVWAYVRHVCIQRPTVCVLLWFEFEHLVFFFVAGTPNHFDGRHIRRFRAASREAFYKADRVWGLVRAATIRV